MQLAYDRDHLPVGQSQNQLEWAALLAVVQALPLGVFPIVLAARGFARAPFLEGLQQHWLDYVVRLNKGITEADGRRWKLGKEGGGGCSANGHPSAQGHPTLAPDARDGTGTKVYHCTAQRARAPAREDP